MSIKTSTVTQLGFKQEEANIELRWKDNLFLIITMSTLHLESGCYVTINKQARLLYTEMKTPMKTLKNSKGMVIKRDLQHSLSNFESIN